MRFYVGVTDNNWFRRLAELHPDEVNFWKPGGGAFRVLEPGGLFLFKLHSPEDFIAGGGFFVRHEALPLSLAWDAFGQKNGAASQRELWRMIQSKRRDGQLNPLIGCTILNQPFFFEREDWIPAPRDWAKSIVQGKGYSASDAVGREIWEQVTERLSRYHQWDTGDSADSAQAVAGGGGLTLDGEAIAAGGAGLVLDWEAIAADGHGGDAIAAAGLGREYLTRARLGQGAFRVLVTGAYHRRCAITGEKTLPVLEAAHIKPFAESGPNHTSNGLLLRSDLHILFDRGYISVAPDLRVEVSPRIKEEFDNGRIYYPLHGQSLTTLPDSEEDRPSREFLAWHNESVYAG